MINGSIGEAEAVHNVILENTTRFTAGEDMFLVAATRNKQLCNMVGSASFLLNGKGKVSHVMQVMRNLGLICRPDLWRHGAPCDPEEWVPECLEWVGYAPRSRRGMSLKDRVDQVLIGISWHQF